MKVHAYSQIFHCYTVSSLQSLSGDRTRLKKEQGQINNRFVPIIFTF